MRIFILAITAIVFCFTGEVEAKPQRAQPKTQKRLTAKASKRASIGKKTGKVAKTRSATAKKTKLASYKQRRLAGVAHTPDASTGELDVRGQSRNLNMMLVLKSKQDKISFVDLKQNYRNEIQETSF